MSNQVIILIGPPGAGKDTQAIWLAEEYGLVQVPSSQIIQKKFAEHPDDPKLMIEKERFDKGLLTDATLIAGWVMEFVRPLAAQGTGVILSGSPRRPLEAEVEFSELPKLYGDRNVRVIHMQLDEAESRRRIADRLFCKANKHPYAASSGLTTCPKDGSPLERRALDAADKQDTRFKEYYEQTVPCLAIAQKYGVAVFPLDAAKSEQAIHHDIVDIVERHRLPL